MQNSDEIFLIDSNAFITPYRNYYQFTFAPSFWKQLNNFATNGRIITLDKVEKELCKEVIVEQKDQMQLWLEDDFTGVKSSSNEQGILENYAMVLNHIQQDSKYNEKALREWADVKVADPWLVAVALEYGYTIISFESKATIQPNNPIGRAKIPNICEDLGVRYCSLFEMMNKLAFSL